LKFKSIDFGPNGNGLLMSFVSSFYAAQNDLFVAISPLSDLSPFWGRQYFYIDANWMKRNDISETNSYLKLLTTS